MKIKDIFTYSDVVLKSALNAELVRFGYAAENMHETKDFLYAEGDAPYMLVAHLDTVHKQIPSIICYSPDGNYIMSPQGIGGDDRCGVYIILSLLHKLDFKPHILFTMGEEVGCVGAKAFVTFLCDNVDKIPDVKFIVEYDRKGNNDCVFYNCDNKKFEKFVNKFGFKTAFGTSSDIKVIAPEIGAAAVNLSSGYYNPHTEHEYVCMADMHDVIDRSVEMLTAECKAFEYVAKPVTTYQCGKHNSQRANGSKYYSQVCVTVLPKNTVNIKFPYGGATCANMDNEIAIDAQGNFYRYFYSYKDWERTWCVEPIQKDFVPKFDSKKSRMISVYSYAYDYEYDY